ncbi:hypothetical protein D3C79_766020 [compost metagenome]
MLLDLSWRQAIEGLWLTLRRGALVGLPIAIGLVCQHSERGQATVGQSLTTVFAGAFIAQQKPHGACRQRPTASPGKQAAKAATAFTAQQVAKPTASTGFAAGTFASLVLQQVLTGFEQLIEQATGVHRASPERETNPKSTAAS